MFIIDRKGEGRRGGKERGKKESLGREGRSEEKKKKIGGKFILWSEVSEDGS